jgi:putative drug exporter of the RND superfamily
VRRPRTWLAVSLAVVAVLGAIGATVEDRLQPTSIAIKGSESAKADDMLRSGFGDVQRVTILLEGPQQQVNAQTPRLSAALRSERGVTVVEPGIGGPDAAGGNTQRLVVADWARPDREANNVAAATDDIVEQTVRPPVRVSTTGMATIGHALEEEGVAATERAELIAFPLLLIVLLLVFRTPLGALVPLLLGGASVAAGRGLLALLTEVTAVDAMALSVGSMMGLALGVDYALLMVSRFREERAGGAAIIDAAQRCRRAAGRTVVFAGATLVFAMATTVLTSPGTLLVSLGTAVTVVGAVSVIIAVVITPSLVLLLGDRLERWPIGPRLNLAQSGARRRPALAVAAVTAGLLLLAAPSVAFDTGPPDIEQLPDSSRAAQDYNHIVEVIGPGWSSPVDVLFAVERGQATSDPNLRRLTAWERAVERDDNVAEVLGPTMALAALESRSLAMRTTARQIVNFDRDGRSVHAVVIPRDVSTDAMAGLRDRLQQLTQHTAGQIGAHAAVGGAAENADFDEATSARFLLIVAALVIVTYLALVVILRSLLLPAIAVLLNLLSVGAAFGVLALLFQGDSPLLGGPGFMDAIAATGIFAVAFALSIDYEVFLLVRMREHWLASRDPDVAIAEGLRTTANVIFGAAFVMAGVFLAFAPAGLTSIRQFGIGLAVAVIVDATVVRLYLLPALMRMAGVHAWWFPAWLDRIMPRLDVEQPGGETNTVPSPQPTVS